MKLHLLRALSKRLKRFDHIVKARRIEENVIEITFSDDTRTRHTYRFDMTRGQSFVYKAEPTRPLQDFNAPFDMLLHQLLTKAALLDAHLVGDDRILRFEVAPKSAYKDRTVFLQLEFTGKNTNAILLDSDHTVIEALRHIGANQSFRTVKPGVALAELPPREAKSKEQKAKSDTAFAQEVNKPIDIDAYLSEAFETYQAKRLAALKQQKTAQLQKKIDTINAQIDALPDETDLMQEAQKLREEANIVLANLHAIKPYDTHLDAYDFKGNPVRITLPSNVPTNRISEHFFNLAKKYERKREHIYIERANLESKRAFYENTLYAVTYAKTPAEVEMLVPKRGRAKRKKEKQRVGELFWIEGYKVMVGRNAKENQALLEQARANDVWMHVRNIPGSHVIIRTDKQNLPESLLQAAAKLCVDFSVKRPGDYEVDYTKRKFVKLVEGSNVVYDKYKTLRVLKEGVEIRI